jgi:hypothetical protein
MSNPWDRHRALIDRLQQEVANVANALEARLQSVSQKLRNRLHMIGVELAWLRDLYQTLEGPPMMAPKKPESLW